MILNNGGDVHLTGITQAAMPSLAGEVVADELVAFTDGSGGAEHGKVQIRVVRTDSGTLDFYYRVTELVGSTGLSQVIWGMNPLTGPIEVDFRLDGLGDAGPSRARRFDTSVGPWVVFDFPDPNTPAPTRFIFVKTHSRDFQRAPRLTMVGPGPDIADFGTIGPWAWGNATIQTFIPN